MCIPSILALAGGDEAQESSYIKSCQIVTQNCKVQESSISHDDVSWLCNLMLDRSMSGGRGQSQPRVVDSQPSR